MKTLLTDPQRRELGLVCGRLYSPAWLIARAKRADRVKRETGETYFVPAHRPVTPLTTSVLPAGFTL